MKIMKKYIPILFVVIIGSVLSAGVEKLDQEYWVQYGSPSAPIKIVEYFSFGCPHCVKAYKADFKKIYINFIKPGHVHWTFHPLPNDLKTVKAMHCLSRLNWVKKQMFLETTLSRFEGISSKNATKLMIRNMESLGRPAPGIRKKSFMEKTKAFSDAYTYMQLKNRVEEVPTIEVNGVVVEDYPSYETISNIVYSVQGKR